MSENSREGQFSLDDLYRMTAHVYGGRNSVRSRERTFAHFVEVCGMLTVEARRKKADRLGLTDVLCKALGWFFPLLAKMKVASVEDLIFRKFPGVCPYCRLAPHDDSICKHVLGGEDTVNHPELVAIYDEQFSNKPVSLDDWQSMFFKIYPRNVQDEVRSLLGLFEEIGELGEAVRVYETHPEFFFGEAADVFSYIMGLANEHALREKQAGRQFSYQNEYLARYPGLCAQCGVRVCVCPAIPSATVGRLAKELKFRTEDAPYFVDAEKFHSSGAAVAERVFRAALDRASAHKRVPFDRGDVNQALVRLCLRIAALAEAKDITAAVSMRGAAVVLADARSPPGTGATDIDLSPILVRLSSQLRLLSDADRASLPQDGILVELTNFLQAAVDV